MIFHAGAQALLGRLRQAWVAALSPNAASRVELIQLPLPFHNAGRLCRNRTNTSAVLGSSLFRF